VNHKLFLLFFSAFYASAVLGRADVLVYVMKGGAAKGSTIDDGTTASWPALPKTTDIYLLNELDGVDESNPEEQITRLGKTFYPSQMVVDHKARKKHLYGNIAEGIGYEVYGRSRDARGRRTFTWLHLQRDGRASSDGARDSGAGVAQGTANWLDIGTGRSGYYAPRLNFQIWRIDGGFSNTFATTQDGRQTKYASAVLNLDLPSTRTINQQGLSRAGAAVWLIQNLFPSYTEQTPDVEGG
jgi:hypothetical protein